MSSGLSEIIRLRADPDLRIAVVAAARAQRISASEYVRRHLRRSLGIGPDLRNSLTAASLAAVRSVTSDASQAHHV